MRKNDGRDLDIHTYLGSSFVGNSEPFS